MLSKVKKDITDELNADQLAEPDKAIKEADTKETISWNDVKRDMDEMEKR